MAKTQVKTKESTKLLVELGGVYAELKGISEKTGINMTRIIRDAVAAKLKTMGAQNVK